MAEIPAALPAAAAQAAMRSREIAQAAELVRAGEQDAATRNVRAVVEADTIVDTQDADSRVFTDAEGQGSQGRAFEQDDEVDSDESGSTSAQASQGIVRSADGRWHVDIEA